MIEFIIGLITGIGSQYALSVIIKLHKATKNLKEKNKEPIDYCLNIDTSEAIENIKKLEEKLNDVSKKLGIVKSDIDKINKPTDPSYMNNYCK